jgi:hypothetical protein
MPEFFLDADWDRDGRVRGTSAERAARQQAPGAIVLPNLDVDGRALSTTVSSTAAPMLDTDLIELKRDDNEAMAATIAAAPDAVPSSFTLALSMRLEATKTLRLRDAHGRRLTETHASGQARFALGSGEATTKILIDAMSLPSSPLGSRSLETLNLEWRDSQGNVAGRDEGVISVSPAILVDNLSPAARLYICEILEEENPDMTANAPTLVDARDATSTAGVRFVVIPDDVNGGDAWVQDQFQQAVCEAPGGAIDVMLHLPRMRSNVVLSQAGPNLAGFVDSHFPSRDIGVFKDFWKREITVTDVAGMKHSISFEQSAELFFALSMIRSAVRQIEFQARLLDKTLPPSLDQRLSAVLHSILNLVIHFKVAVTSARKDAIWANNLRELDKRERQLTALASAVISAFPSTPAGTAVPIVPKQPLVELKDADLDALDDRLNVLHDSINYGGNVEVGPSDDTNPYGKIVVGNGPADDRHLDPDLVDFLHGQSTQPVVEIDTTWLHVAHVDEIIAFVPDRQAASKTAIVRASPGLAMEILDELRARHMAGLPSIAQAAFRPYVYNKATPRRTDRGSFPVTHLLRGKSWLHRHRRGDVSSHEPPMLYREFANADAKGVLGPRRVDYVLGVGADRWYPANLSIHELNFFENGTNADLEANQLASLAKTLSTEFARSQQIALPVLFDNRMPFVKPPPIPDAEPPSETTPVEKPAKDPDFVGSTSAFLPDLANLQVLGNHLLLPRPYGPRVRVNDAVSLLTFVFDADRARGHDAIRKEFLVKRGLTTPIHWARPDLGPSTLSDVAAMFADGFGGKAQDDVEAAVRRANPGQFLPDGRLRPGWRRLIIPDGTVDVFEAYTELALAPLGVQVHWVDSWYYHIRFGGIHCATNVARQRPKFAKPWWNVRQQTSQE